MAGSVTKCQIYFIYSICYCVGDGRTSNREITLTTASYFYNYRNFACKQTNNTTFWLLITDVGQMRSITVCFILFLRWGERVPPPVPLPPPCVRHWQYSQTIMVTHNRRRLINQHSFENGTKSFHYSVY